MKITIGDPGCEALEALAIEGYRSGALSHIRGQPAARPVAIRIRRIPEGTEYIR